MDTLVNRVANSSIQTIDLATLAPSEDIVVFDIKDYLFKELILKEKEFRLELKELDWQQYAGKIVLVYCSSDAIIPMWAYMLIESYLQGIATETYSGDMTAYLSHHYDRAIEHLDPTIYKDKPVVIKGCGDETVPPQAYLKLTGKLRTVAKKIMYGEPCSTVLICKK